MKTKSLSTALVSLTAVYAALNLLGCSSSSNGTMYGNSCDTEILAGSASLCITLDPAAPTLADTAGISISDPNLVSVYSWTLTWADSGERVTNCGGNAVMLNCQFDRGGVIAINLNGRSRTGESLSLLRVVRILDTNAAVNQAPKIVAEVKKSGVTNTFESGKVATTMRIEDGLEGWGDYVLDFSKSVDDNDPTASLKFEIAFESSNFVRANGLLHTINIPAGSYGAHEVQVRATDVQGASRILKFQIVNRCPVTEAQMNAFTLDSAGLIVGTDIGTSDEGPNAFTYKLDTSKVNLPAVVPSKSLQISLDMNGDGLFDDFLSSKITNGAIYTKVNVFDQAFEWNIFNGNRKLGVRVLDTICGLEKDFEVEKTFNIKRAIVSNNYSESTISVTGGELAVMQAKVHRLTPIDPTWPANFKRPYEKMTSNSDGTDADIIAHWKTGPQRVQCDYQGNMLHVSGKNMYRRKGDSTTKFHGMNISIGGIHETRANGIASVDTSAAYITDAQYVTDASNENFTQLAFNKNGNCSVKTVITGVLLPVGCCATGPAGDCLRPIMAWDYLIQGAFGCDRLTATSGSESMSVSLGYEDAAHNREGAYLCRVQLIDGVCPGGAGGSGGGAIIPR